MKHDDINHQFAIGVLGILRLAGQAIMEVYEQADHGVEIKDDKSPLTEADRRSHKIILEYLTKLTPRIPIVSEEDKEETATQDWYWLVDPLDGTKEFIKRNGEFTVMAALMHKEHPVFGAIHAPDKKVDYYGGINLPPARIELGSEHGISVAESLHDPLVVLASRSHSDAKSKAFLDNFGKYTLTSIGSSFKFCQIADGTADLYVRYHPTMEWDTAAGQAIVEAAGGKLVSVDGGEFKYGKKGRKNGGFIVFNPLLKADKFL